MLTLNPIMITIGRTFGTTWRMNVRNLEEPTASAA